MHRLKNLFFVVFLLGLWKAGLLAIAAVAPLVIKSNFLFIPELVYRRALPEIIWTWANFDGEHYIKIADLGYRSLEHIFFPFYPILIRLTFQTFHVPPLIAALAISHIALIIALGLVALILRLDGYKVPLWFFLCVFLFPTSFFYTAAYNDALFFCLATLTLFLARKKLWLAAGIAGGLATLTRLNGLALFPFLIFELYAGDHTAKKSMTLFIQSLHTWRKWILEKVRKSTVLLLPTLLIFGALAAFLIYNQLQAGHWWYVFDDAKIWREAQYVFPLRVVWRYINMLFLHPTIQFQYWVAAGELFFVLFYAALLCMSFSRLRTSYWMFFFVSFLIPAGTGTFQGMPRYGLHLYPMFLTIYLLLKNRSWKIKALYFGVSTVLLILYEALFLRGYFVA